MDFWFDFASTYSYPAAMRVEELAAQRGIKISWRPLLLGPIFAEYGWQDSPFNIFPSKGRYMWRDLERICQDQDIAFCRPSEFPRNGLLAARVACRFADSPWLPGFVRAVYRSNFEKDLDISTPATVAHCIVSAGEDPATVIKEAQATESKDMLRAQTEEASRLGIFGAPSFVVGTELFWGNDRLEDALNWAAEHHG